jgi:hypothetical protein
MLNKAMDGAGGMNMKRLKNQILMALGFAVLAGVISGITAGPAIAQAIKAVLVKNVDEHGRVPFVVTDSCDTTTTNSCSIILPGPLPNKRLVLEHISTFHRAANVMQFSSVVVNVGQFTFKDRAFVNPRLVSVGGESRYSANEPILIYVGSGEVINVSSVYTMNGVSSNTVVLSGYIVDLGI